MPGLGQGIRVRNTGQFDFWWYKYAIFNKTVVDPFVSNITPNSHQIVLSNHYKMSLSCPLTAELNELPLQTKQQVHVVSKSQKHSIKRVNLQVKIYLVLLI